MKNTSPTKPPTFRAILRMFSRDMLKAIKLKDSPNKPDWFISRVGVCYNFNKWLNFNNINAEWAKDQLFHLLGSNYPFNSNRSTGYDRESDTGTMYKNPQRLAWLRKYNK